MASLASLKILIMDRDGGKYQYGGHFRRSTDFFRCRSGRHQLCGHTHKPPALLRVLAKLSPSDDFHNDD